MSLSQNYPTTRPTLTLDFAKAKRVDPRVTFTRVTAATYFDASGTLRSAAANAPRIDFDPATLACRGLLIEEQRTNLLLQSENFATTWSALNVTPSTDTSLSPAGTLTADTLTPAASTAAHLISQSATVTASTAYSASVFVKSDGAPFVQIVYDNGASVGAFINVNLSTGAITRGPELAGGATNATGGVVPIGNGFYRVSIGATHTGTTGRVLISPLPAGQSAAGLNPSTTTAATDKIIVWGAQLEAGAFPASYIPTTTAAATRAADVASVNTLSPWFNASEGTIYAEAVGVNNISGATRRFAEIGDGTINDRFVVGYSTTSKTRFLAIDGGSNQADVQVTTGVPVGSLIKMAAAYAVNNFQQASNGTLGTADTSGTLPTVTTMYLGGDTGFGATTALNGHLRRIAYYNTRLPNEQLQALTAP